jgi:hypothetical protein
MKLFDALSGAISDWPSTLRLICVLAAVTVFQVISRRIGHRRFPKAPRPPRRLGQRRGPKSRGLRMRKNAIAEPK